MRKYKNIETKVGEKKFASRKEAKRFQELIYLELGNVITNLRTQVSFQIIEPMVICGKKERANYYVADFVYEMDGRTVVEDVKGFRTDVYKMKRKLMKAVHNIDVYEI